MKLTKWYNILQKLPTWRIIPGSKWLVKVVKLDLLLWLWPWLLPASPSPGMILQPEIATLGVSLNGGTPHFTPQVLIISSRKTPWVCWAHFKKQPPYIAPLHHAASSGFPGDTPQPSRWARSLMTHERMKPSFSSSKSWNQTFLGEHDFLAGCIYNHLGWC